MQNQNNGSKKSLNVKIITPDSEMLTFSCDSVMINIKDASNGKGGGKYGIHCGHAKAVFSLAEGVIVGKKDGETAFSVKTAEGFVKTDADTVTVITERATY